MYAFVNLFSMEIPDLILNVLFRPSLILIPHKTSLTSIAAKVLLMLENLFVLKMNVQAGKAQEKKK